MTTPASPSTPESGNSGCIEMLRRSSTALSLQNSKQRLLEAQDAHRAQQKVRPHGDTVE